MKLKKLNVLSFAKFQGVLFTLVGLIAGIIYSFGGLIIDTLVTMEWMTTNETPGLSFGTVLAFGALIGMPLIFAVFGIIAGILESFLYNIFAKWFGGINIEFE